MAKNSKRLLLLLYGIFIFVVYICFINNSKGYEWDASNIASWADEARYVFPGQQNHLLQSILNTLWCNIWKFFGYSKGCLIPLRVLSCIFGATGAVGFFILLYKIFEKNTVALFGSLGLAYSFFYWAFSTDLETHLLPASLFIYCLILLFSLEKSDFKKTVLMGSIHSLCIYLSGIYIFFAPAVVAGIMTVKDTAGNRYKGLLYYLLSLVIFWVIPFLIIGIYFYKVDFGLKYADNITRHLFIWFRGFEITAPFSLSELLKIPGCYYVSIHYITKYCWLTIGFGISTLIFYFIYLLKFVPERRLIITKFSRVILIAFCLIIPYQLTLLFYEPSNAQRYTHFLPAIWLLLCCLAYPFFVGRRKLLLVFPFIFIALIFLANLVFYILPRHLLVLGPVRQKLWEGLNLEAENLYKQGQYQKTAEVLNKAIMVLITTFGYNHPEVAMGFEKSAGIYDKMQQKEEAMNLRAKAAKIRLGEADN